MTDSGMARWADRVALVTGASSGIGFAVAKRLSDAGMRVAAAGRRVERLEALAEACGDGELFPVRVDLRKEEEILNMFEIVRERWGEVDVLVNNAGLGYHEPLHSGSTERWREMLEVNVLALSICTREAVKGMLARESGGHIIHVSSMAAHRVPGGSGVYSATKYAVRSLTEGLRQELRALGSKVRVSSVSPGLVETEFHARFFGSEDEARARYDQIEVLKPEDVADSVLHILAAPERAQIHDILLRPTEQAG